MKHFFWSSLITHYQWYLCYKLKKTLTEMFSYLWDTCLFKWLSLQSKLDWTFAFVMFIYKANVEWWSLHFNYVLGCWPWNLHCNWNVGWFPRTWFWIRTTLPAAENQKTAKTCHFSFGYYLQQSCSSCYDCLGLSFLKFGFLQTDNSMKYLHISQPCIGSCLSTLWNWCEWGHEQIYLFIFLWSS